MSLLVDDILWLQTTTYHGRPLDNLDNAIYHLLNKLATRHGLRPCDFRAILCADEKDMSHQLVFTWPADEDPQMEMRYRTMLINLGVPRGGNALDGSADAIYAALVHALKHTPPRQSHDR